MSIDLLGGYLGLMPLDQGGLYLVGGYLGLTVLGTTGNFWLALLAAGVGVGILSGSATFSG